MHQANTDGNENNDTNACLKTCKKKYKKTTYTGYAERTPAQTPKMIRWAIGKATD